MCGTIIPFYGILIVLLRFMKICLTHLLFLFALCAAHAQGPELSHFENFGYIPEGKLDTTDFRIVNRDSVESIWIKGWKPGCACVSLLIPNHEVKPGQSLTVKFIYNSSGNLGTIRRYARIGYQFGNTNDSI